MPLLAKPQRRDILLEILAHVRRQYHPILQVEMRSYFLPSANPPNVLVCIVITSGPVIWPATIGLSGTVS